MTSPGIIGYTDDLRARLKRHNAGTGAGTTSLKKNWKLIYYEAYLLKADALGREKFLKSGFGRIYLKKQMKNYLANYEATKWLLWSSILFIE